MGDRSDGADTITPTFPRVVRRLRYQTAVQSCAANCRRLVGADEESSWLEGPLSGKIIDDADAVGAWTGDALGLVLFPTAETVGELRKIAEARKNGLVIIAIPVDHSGQVISDFGVLPWVRKPAMELVKSFQDVYIVKQLRINGDDTRWMYTYPYGWQIFVVRGPQDMTTILTTDTQPSYNEVEKALRSLPWTMSSKGLLDRIQAEAEFNRRSLESLPPNE
eukprot:jgi/Picre1/28477/NNA_003881.t1